MNSFTLPSLRHSFDGRSCTSEVQLPEQLPADFLGTIPKQVLPEVGKSQRVWEIIKLRRKRSELETQLSFDVLERQERNLRAALVGREHEKRHNMLWEYQKELATLEFNIAVAAAAALSRQRARYMRGIREFEERGYLLHSEVVGRTDITSEEEAARQHVMSIFELRLMKSQHADAGRDLQAAHDVLSDLQDVQNLERRLLESVRLAPAFAPRIELINVRNKGKGMYKGRENLLMDYTPCEEEYKSRCLMVLSERLNRTSLEWEHGAALIELQEETSARGELGRLFLFGLCQARLDGIILVQRWWRLLRTLPWSARRRRALSVYFGDRRYRMTSRDYNVLLERLNRKKSSTCTQLSLADIESSMAALVRALEMSYQNTFDYHTYTLMNRVSQLQSIGIHNLHLSLDVTEAPVSATRSCGGDGVAQKFPFLRMPHRVFVRMHALQPYPRWRVNRWVEGSFSLIRLQQRNIEEETAARSLLEHEERSAANTLQLFFATLKQGDWAWRSLCTSILFIAHQERVVRDLLTESEQEARATLTVTATAEASKHVTWDSERTYVLQEEAMYRGALEILESEEVSCIIDGEWRWGNLGRLRKKLFVICGSSVRWKLETERGFGAKFVSLNSTASVIARFYRRVQKRRAMAARRRGTAQPEAHVIQTAKVMLSLLQQQIDEDHEDIGHAIAAFGAAAAVILVPMAVAEVPVTSCHCSEPETEARAYVDTAASLFCKWFDERAGFPREEDCREVVRRFVAANDGLYRGVQLLIAQLEECRGLVEEEEVTERGALQFTEPCVHIGLYNVTVNEETERQQIISQAEEVYPRWCEEMEFISALARCSITTASEMRSLPVCRAERKSKVIKKVVTKIPLPPRPSNIDLILGREDIRRTRVHIEEVREREATLLSLHAAIADTLMREECRERLAVCMEVDSSWPRHLPVAQLMALQAQEKVQRHALDREWKESYGSLFVAMCLWYAEEMLMKQFIRGYLCFDSEIRYFDRHLSVLLRKRLVSLGTKPQELTKMEDLARGRLEFLEEKQRSLLESDFSF
ncbi:hypothetical protein TRVL_04625 [Trypanosoma vivax]|nr:hypothetical protein TRVL_04625 [Trypanosoma vivax]